MTFCGSSVGSCSVGRLGPDALGEGDGDSAAIATGTEMSSSTAAAAQPSRAVLDRNNGSPLADEARGEVADRLRQEAQDHTDDRAYHQSLAALVTADRALGEVEAGAEHERQAANREQDALDPAGDPVERGADLLAGGECRIRHG